MTHAHYFLLFSVLCSASHAFVVSVQGTTVGQSTVVKWTRDSQDPTSFCIVVFGPEGQRSTSPQGSGTSQISTTFSSSGVWTVMVQENCSPMVLIPLAETSVTVSEAGNSPKETSSPGQDSNPSKEGPGTSHTPNGNPVTSPHSPQATASPTTQQPSNPTDAGTHTQDSSGNPTGITPSSINNVNDGGALNKDSLSSGSPQTPAFDQSPSASSLYGNPIVAGSQGVTVHGYLPSSPSSSTNGGIPVPTPPGAVIVSKSASKTSLIVGVVFGILILLAFIAAAVFFYHRRRRRHRMERTTIFYKEKMIRPRSFHTFWKPLPPIPGTVSILPIRDPQITSTSSWASLAPDLDPTTLEDAGSDVTSMLSTSTSHSRGVITSVRQQAYMATPLLLSTNNSRSSTPLSSNTGFPGPLTPSLHSSMAPSLGHNS